MENQTGPSYLKTETTTLVETPKTPAAPTIGTAAEIAAQKYNLEKEAKERLAQIERDAKAEEEALKANPTAQKAKIKVLKETVEGKEIEYLTFKCPGCKNIHKFKPASWNQDVYSPSVPSKVLFRFEYVNFDGIKKKGICKFSMDRGTIKFENDSTHVLRNLKVAIPVLPKELL